MHIVGLLMHDEADRERLKESLITMHQTVVEYQSSTQMMGEVLAAHHNGRELPIGILMLDLVQPNEISGVEVIERLRQHVPAEKLAFILLIGDSPEDKRLAEAHLLDVAKIRKPLMALKMFTKLKENHMVVYG